MGLLDAILDPRFRRDVAQGLLDAGNRGVVAGLLGAPVDMASGVANAGRMAVGFLGNKAGLLSADQMPQPIEKPVGGSEWIGDLMQRAGMVSGNRNPVAETLAGAVLPVAAVPAARAVYRAEQAAPAVARDFASTPSVQRAVDGYMERMGMKLPITVWHGSPHKFDKFDASKIGTGEGAQAYGHGLYLAEAPDVARTYLGTGQTVGGSAAESRLAKVMERATDAGRYGEALALEELLVSRSPAKAIARFSDPGGGEQYKDALVAVQKYGKHFKEGGEFYKVDLPDSAVAKMLDWDAPLSKQTLEAQKLGAEVFANEPRFDPAYTRGMELYHALNAGNGPVASRQAVERIRQAGIPGIRYLDGGSRGAGAGTSNFVIFPQNEGLLTILERNGIPLP